MGLEKRLRHEISPSAWKLSPSSLVFDDLVFLGLLLLVLVLRFVSWSASAVCVGGGGGGGGGDVTSKRVCTFKWSAVTLYKMCCYILPCVHLCVCVRVRARACV